MSVDRKAERAHERLDEHETVHEQFDRRISNNENFRLQARGGLKVLAVVSGTGALGVLLDLAGVL